MKRLLLAYDDSECSRTALTETIRAGLPATMEVMVLSVADIWMPGDGSLEGDDENALPDNVRKARARGREHIKAHGQLASQAGAELKKQFPSWNIQSVASTGSPAFTIVDKAREWQADLIVLGSHGRGPLRSFLLGSVTQVVATNASCSVHITRPGSHSTHLPPIIAIAVDGSPDSQKIVHSVLDRNWPKGTFFQLLTVLDSRHETADSRPTLYASEWTQRHDVGVMDCLCRLIEHLSTQIADRGWEVETHIVEGDPKKLILEKVEQWNVGCLVLGAHGLEHGEQRLLGSTATALLTRAHCAVEIVR